VLCFELFAQRGGPLPFVSLQNYSGEFMTRKLALLTLVLFVVAFASAVSMAQDGAATFKGKCVMCHGADGSGKTAMGEKFGIRDLRSADVQKQTDAQLVEIVTKGKNKMPAYDGKLTKEQVDQVVAFIRTLKK
jgi:mono/diheme cytochrome c family protein